MTHFWGSKTKKKLDNDKEPKIVTSEESEAQVCGTCGKAMCECEGKEGALDDSTR